jgi:hypothetical protein
LIAIEDIGKQSWKTLHRFWPRKGDRQFYAVANFGELKQLTNQDISPLPGTLLPNSDGNQNYAPS